MIVKKTKQIQTIEEIIRQKHRPSICFANRKRTNRKRTTVRMWSIQIFFDEGYTMAGTTGFKVWTGSRLLIETLVAGPWFGSPSSLPETVVPQQPPQNNSHNCHRNLRRLHEIQQRLQQDKHPVRILELGAGVGLVGTYLAAATGAEVLLTDLPTLVEHAIVPNLYRNHELFLVDPTSTRTITTLDTNNDTNNKNNHDHGCCADHH